MMRTTSILLLGAAALYFGALATPSPSVEVPSRLALDFEGIRALEIRSPGRVDLVLSTKAPQVSWDRTTLEGVQVERLGDTLRLSAASSLYGQVSIQAPLGLERLDVDSADVDAIGRAGRVAIQATGALDWEGDAEALDIRHAGTPCAAGRCPTLTIRPGADTELSVTAEFAELDVHLPARTQAARIRLGSCATLDLRGARRLDAVSIDALPPRACPEPEEDRPTATASITP